MRSKNEKFKQETNNYQTSSLTLFLVFEILVFLKFVFQDQQECVEIVHINAFTNHRW